MLVLCKSKAPHAFQLSQQLRDLRTAAKVNLEILKQDLKTLHVDLREALAYLSSLEPDTDAKGGGGGGGGDVRLGGFLEGAGRELEVRILKTSAFL
jgi:hypothetical protein